MLQIGSVVHVDQFDPGVEYAAVKVVGQLYAGYLVRGLFGILAGEGLVDSDLYDRAFICRRIYESLAEIVPGSAAAKRAQKQRRKQYICSCFKRSFLHI